jgi:hypothetical protein
MARRKVERKPATERVNAEFGKLELPRMANADLVKPPSAVKRRHVSKASMKALEKHAGVDGKPVVHTNRKAPGVKKAPRTDYSRMPTAEAQASNEYVRMEGERVDVRNKGEMLLVNMTSRAGGAGVMFNRGQISRRELGAAMKVCELAERASLSQLSGALMGERVDGGKVDLSGSRLTAAAAAHGELRDALALLSRQGRVLVEKCIVGRMAMEEAVRVRPLAEWLGDGNIVRNKCKKAIVLLRDALDKLADAFHLPEA